MEREREKYIPRTVSFSRTNADANVPTGCRYKCCVKRYLHFIIHSYRRNGFRRGIKYIEILYIVSFFFL